MRKTLLVIGDLMMNERRFEASLNRFITYKPRLNRRNIGVIFITYDDVVAGRLPTVSTKRLDLLLFFPYNHWNSEIERYDKDKRIYGDIDFGRDYTEYLLSIDRIIKRRYRDKHLVFVNPSAACVLDRDKKKTYDRLKRAAVNSPRIYDIRKVSQIEALVDEGNHLYVKPRFGAMGKGITYIDKTGIYTNFLFRKGKVINRLYDYNWRPIKISRDNGASFLKILIGRGFLVQDAIDTPIYKTRKFDIRIYVVYGKVPYYYAKSAPCGSFITNWSQGGRIEKRAFLRGAIGEKAIGKAKLLARKSAKIMGLDYAGVDVIIDGRDGTMHVLEIQSFPGYERGFDLMKFLSAAI